MKIEGPFENCEGSFFLVRRLVRLGLYSSPISYRVGIYFAAADLPVRIWFLFGRWTTHTEKHGSPSIVAWRERNLIFQLPRREDRGYQGKARRRPLGGGKRPQRPTMSVS